MKPSKINVFEVSLIGAALLALVGSFLPWYSVSQNILGIVTVSSSSYNGWHFSLFMWLAILVPIYVAARALLTAGGVLKPISHFRTYAGLAAASALIVGLRLVTFHASAGLTGHVGAGAPLVFLAALATTVTCIIAARHKDAPTADTVTETGTPA